MTDFFDTQNFRRAGQHTWTSVPYTWSNIPFIWSDVPILVAIAHGRGSHLDRYKKLKEYEKERVIELICTVRGEKYIKKKTIKNINVTTKDLDILIKGLDSIISVEINKAK